MKVRVKILGALTKPFGKDDFEHEVAARACLEELLIGLGYHPGHLRFLVTSVNDRQEKLGYLLREGDQVTLMLPTSGG